MSSPLAVPHPWYLQRRCTRPKFFICVRWCVAFSFSFLSFFLFHNPTRVRGTPLFLPARVEKKFIVASPHCSLKKSLFALCLTSQRTVIAVWAIEPLGQCPATQAKGNKQGWCPRTETSFGFLCALNWAAGGRALTARDWLAGTGLVVGFIYYRCHHLTPPSAPCFSPAPYPHISARDAISFARGLFCASSFPFSSLLLCFHIYVSYVLLCFSFLFSLASVSQSVLARVFHRSSPPNSFLFALYLLFHPSLGHRL